MACKKGIGDRSQDKPKPDEEFGGGTLKRNPFSSRVGSHVSNLNLTAGPDVVLLHYSFTYAEGIVFI